MDSSPIVFCIILIVTIKIRLVCSVLNPGKDKTPSVMLRNFSSIFNESGKITYNLTHNQAIKLNLTCESDKPTRWIWKSNGEVVRNVKVEKDRKEINGILCYLSNLIMEFSDEEQLETNFTCINEIDNPRNIGTCIRVNETQQGNSGPVIIRVDKNENIDRCLAKERNYTGVSSCKTQIKVDINKRVHLCEPKGRPKSIACSNLDECKSLIYENVEGERLSCTGSLQTLTLAPTNFTLEASPHISFCRAEAEQSEVRDSWISHILLYPSFGKKDWRNFTFHVNMTEAISTNSIQIFSLDRDRIAEKFKSKPVPTNSSYEFAENETVTIGCRAVYSLYMKGFRMRIGSNMSNETVSDGPLRYTSDETSHIHYLEQSIRLDTSKYGNISWISCDGKIWNSKEWFSSRMNILLNPVQVPSVNLTDSPYNNTKDSFALKCVYRGWPRPQIHFSFSEKVISIKNESDPDPDGHYRHDLQWSQTQVIKKTQGSLNVTCFATNFHGTSIASVILEDSSKQFSSEQFIQIVVICSVIVFIITAGIIGIFYWRYRQKLVLYSQTQQLTTEEIEEFYSGAKESSTIYEALLLPYNNEYEVQRDDLNLDGTILGSGQFGLVLKGSIGPLTVAVKTVKPTADVIYLRSLLSELKILQFVGAHRNIVNLIGADTSNIKNREVLLVLDYCSNGSLINFLRQCRERFVDFFGNTSNEKQQSPLYENSRDVTITTGNLILFATEIASAMEHLVSKNIIHGDLAARNVLVTEDLHAKICDFGLAKQLFHYSVYVQKINCPLPLRWMAIESLQDMEFSLASDRWSYGITLWEIFSLAELPYPGVPWSFESYKALQEGYRMPKPAYANDSIYKIMLQCWSAQPQERPSYEYVIEELRKEVESLT